MKIIDEADQENLSPISTPSPIAIHEEDILEEEMINESLNREEQRQLKEALKKSIKEMHVPPAPRYQHEAGPSQRVPSPYEKAFSKI
jgi:hypothetical protein